MHCKHKVKKNVVKRITLTNYAGVSEEQVISYLQCTTCPWRSR